MPLSDPMADRLRSVVAQARTAAEAAEALFGITEIFGRDLPAEFAGLVTEQLALITSSGVASALN